MRLRAEAQLANPSNVKPAAAEQANPLDSDTATPSVSENATITPFPVPAPNSSINVRQETDNYYCKLQLRTAPIAVCAIVEPTAATNIPTPTHTDPATVPAWLANDDCDTVAKVEARLLRMEQYWAESRTGPFPESVRNAIAELRASFEKRDMQTTPTASMHGIVLG